MIQIISRISKTSNAGIVALLDHEDLVPGPYLDSVGVWTWGVGHTAAAGAPLPAKMPRGMPSDMDAALDQIFTVFAADLASYEADVAKALKVPVAQHEFDALVSFHFNTGAIARAEVTRLLNKGDRAGAAKAFLNWRTPEEIVERRKKERALFRDGTYAAGQITVWNVNAAGKITWKIAKKLTTAEALARMSAYLADAPVATEAPEDTGALEVDPATNHPILARGSRGAEVTKAQKLLTALGFNLGTIHGQFGDKTWKAVRAFQKSCGLKVDGRLGPITWAALTKGT